MVNNKLYRLPIVIDIRDVYCPLMDNRLKELRLAAGLTQGEVAKGANTTTDQISKLERSERGMTINWMKRLAPVLRCKPADLIDDTNPDEAIMAYVSDASQKYLKDKGSILASDDFGRLISRLYPLASREAMLNNGIPELTKSQIDDALRSITN